MTAELVDDMTDTRSDKTRESWGQGAANIITGLFGGMGGRAMIGQTMINVKASRARTRMSTFLAGLFLLILVVAPGGVVALIAMAALVAMVAFARRVAHVVTVTRTEDTVDGEPHATCTVDGELFFASTMMRERRGGKLGAGH